MPGYISLENQFSPAEVDVTSELWWLKWALLYEPDVTLKYVKVHKARQREMHVKVGNCKDVGCVSFNPKDTYSGILTHPIRPCSIKECHPRFQLKKCTFLIPHTTSLKWLSGFYPFERSFRTSSYYVACKLLDHSATADTVSHTSSSRSRGQSNWRCRRRRWLSREKNDANWRCGFLRALGNRVSTNIVIVGFPQINRALLNARESWEKTKRRSIESQNEGVNLVRIVTFREFNGLQI